MRNTRDALEAALVENPDDLVLHAAYSDLLIEEGDPRGEFIRLQLMLGDASLSKEQRDAASRQSGEMLRKYRRVWLTPTPGLTQNLTRGLQTLGWARGWVESCTITQNTEMLHVIASIPACRLIRSITMNLSEEEYSWSDAARLAAAISKFRLESLSISDYPAGQLLVESLDKSGMSPRLKTLRLIACVLTDESAQILARLPTISQLNVLNLSENYISPAGFADLRAAGANVSGEASQRFGRQIG